MPLRRLRGKLTDVKIKATWFNFVNLISIFIFHTSSQELTLNELLHQESTLLFSGFYFKIITLENFLYYAISCLPGFLFATTMISHIFSLPYDVVQYVFFFFSHLSVYHSRVYHEPTKWPAPSWLVGSGGGALHRYRRDHGFDSHTTEPDFFLGFIFTAAQVVFITTFITLVFIL